MNYGVEKLWEDWHGGVFVGNMVWLVNYIYICCMQSQTVLFILIWKKKIFSWADLRKLLQISLLPDFFPLGFFLFHLEKKTHTNIENIKSPHTW